MSHDTAIVDTLFANKKTHIYHSIKYIMIVYV